MNLQELSKKFEEVKAKMMEEGRLALNVEFAKCFDAYPEITAIKWSQYTPWFNDGETCEFSVNSFVVTNAPDAENVDPWGDYDGEDENVFVHQMYSRDNKAKYPLITELQSFCEGEIGTDIMLKTFDNHVVVTATRSGFEVEEFEHD